MAGWNFTGNCIAGWEIATGKLQVKNFGTFVGTCSHDAADRSGLPRQPEVPERDAGGGAEGGFECTARITAAEPIFRCDDSGREFTVTTGKTPRQHNVYEIARTDLGQVFGVGTSFQPVVQVSGTMASPGNTGVQIESIAVMGNP